MEPLTAIWRRAEEPAAAHGLAEALLEPGRYARTRGVAQQAARLARAAHLDRRGRRRLLACAWLHDLGTALGPGLPALAAGRALRRAGHEDLARIVAHRGNAAFEAALRDLPPLAREFPPPRGADRSLLTLLDIAVLTTGPDGARATPAAVLRRIVEEEGGAAGPQARVVVALVARIGDDPGARALLERVAPRAA